MATVQEVINIAYARNKRAQQEVDATPEELFRVLEEIMGRWFSAGTRVNLEWFTIEDTISYNDEDRGWRRPAAAESVHLIMDGATKVAKVPFDQKDAEPAKPAVYRLAGVYRTATSANGPGAGKSLTFFYCRRPLQIRSAEAELDPMWPAGHEALLGLELALFLSRKDNRNDDLDSLMAQRDECARWYIEFLEHEDRGTVYPTGRVREWAYGFGKPMRG